MWPHRRADEAPLPRAAKARGRNNSAPPLGRRSAAPEGRRGPPNAWDPPCAPPPADEAPLSNAGAFFPTQQVPRDRAWSKMLERFLVSSARFLVFREV